LEKTHEEKKLIIITLVLGFMLNYCNKKNIDIPQEKITPISGQADVSFTLVKSVPVNDMASPRMAVSENRDRIYIIGGYTVKEN